MQINTWHQRVRGCLRERWDVTHLPFQIGFSYHTHSSNTEERLDMAINIGPIITNAHAAQNLTHMAIIRNIRQAGRCGPDSDEIVDDTEELISEQGEVNPLRVTVFALLSLIIGVVLLVYSSWAGERIANLPQVYKPQVELSKREYYPAHLVNKYHNEACNSKTGTCTSRYIFVVKHPTFKNGGL